MIRYFRSRLRLGLSLIGIVVLVAMALLADGRTARAASVTPTLVPGNPTCADLNSSWFELKVDPPASGTYTDGTITVTVTVAADNKSFDWSSNLGVDAVISKGGAAANLYTYDPPAESTGDTNLVAPNNSSGGPAGLSHMAFCYDLELDVSKTAETSFTRTFEWSVEKSVDPASWSLFNGDTGTSAYQVDVTKTGYTDSAWAVSGQITIVNPAASLAATITSVDDAVSGIGDLAVDCGVSFPYQLAGGATLTCDYSGDLPDGSDRVNTATVATSGAIQGGSGSADVLFGDPTTLVDDSVTLTDSMAGDLGSFSDTGSASYDHTFACGDDAGTHDNIATITGDDSGRELDSASASVTVDCYSLDVAKSAETTSLRTLTYDWTIAKTASAVDLTAGIGESAFVTYDVTADVTLASDVVSDFAVSGSITISNPAPMDATLLSVNDLISPVIAVAVDCPSMTVPAGGSLTCSYSSDLPDGSSRINTAAATQQNYAYASDGSASASGTTDYTGSANVAFGDPTTTQAIDDCVDVSDSLAGFLGSLCRDEAPFTWEYTLDLGQRPTCGDYVVTNTATAVTTESGATDSASATVTVHVPCPVAVGCTPGFWKNNLAKHGGSAWPIDPNSISPFGGKTFAQAIGMTGKNIIYAHAAAAYLNALTLADYPYSVDDVIALFNAGDLNSLAAANELGCPLSQN